MNENEKPALGSTEAAVLTVVELIARAAKMSEQHLAYWLDLYYQVRSRYEFKRALTLDDMVVKTEWPGPAAEFIKQFAEEEEPESVERLPDGAFKGKTGTFRKGNDEPHDVVMEEQTPVMRGRETIKLQERAKSETRSEAVKKQKAAEREFKIRVAERLREARTHGVKIGEIVTASCGNVPDGAVLTILDGGFRPIADYRALDAALDQLAEK